MDKTRMGKRVASLLLSLVMMLSLLPTAAYATMADGVDTQGAIVSENGTDVSDDSNSSGGTGDLQVEDSEGNGDTGAQQVGGSSGSGTADDTTGAEGGADPTDSVNGNDSTDPQDDGDAVMPVASSVVSTSEELVAAIAAANDGDTITLGEGEFTTYGNTSPEKSLTFVGAGTGTVWTIGDLDKDVGGEGNGDCSFDGCNTVTFRNMTLKSNGADYRGFIRISNTVVENCTLKGKTAYWGYETAKFEDSTFNAPVGDYALWDYSTKAMTFEGCTFNISGKGVNVYVEQPSTDARTVEVNGCTVNSDKAGKAFLNIKNSTQSYDVTLSGTNTVNGLTADGTTGSALYQVETTKVTETTGNPVTVKAKADDGTVTTLYEVKETVEASVAEVNGAKYKSLQAAVDAAKSGATVTLLADTRENVTVSKNAIVLDLNGHTLNGGTENAKPALTVDNKKVTLKDSSEAQTGTIKREDTADTKTSHYVIDIQGKNGFMIVESGKVENNSGIPGVKGSSLIRLGNDSVSGWPTLTIKGGTFTQDNFIAIKVDRGTLHLLGGTVNSANSFAIENWNNAYIKGGTVNGTVSTWVYSTGAAFSKLEISGGTVNGNVASVNYDNAADKQARVYVTGGTVTGTLGTYTYNNGLVAMDETAKATIEVTGGTFSKDPTQYVVEDSAISKNDDGTYGVAKTYLAKIGDTEYYTMDEAFHAVKAGETIVMLRDYTTNKVQNSGDESFTIDLGGHTWTANIVDTASAAFEINYSDVTLTVKNGKVVSSQLAGLIPSAMSGTITYNNSKLVFDGVEMTANGHSGIETNGSNTNDTVTLKNSTLNVPNGYGIYFPSSGTLTIDNSVINAKTMGVQVCSGSLNISGAGTAITVTGDGIAKTENDGAIEDGAAISIVERTGYKGLIAIKVESGTFTAKAGNDAVKAYKWDNTNKTESAFDNSKNVVAVSGGTFSSEVDKSLCADGFIPTQNEDGTYGVKEGKFVAEVGSTKYETLAEAVAAAEDGQTVRLLADVEQNTQLAIDKSITLDLNGKTIKNTADIWGDNANAILSITKGAKVTITGNGTIDAKENDCYAINMVKGDLTIENGTFYGNVSVVQVQEGTLSVKGGTFDLHQKWEGSSKYLINCIDDAYVGGSANVAISGGTFVGFDPNVSPEQKVDGKTPSFAAPGVGITRNENGSFTAVDGMTAQILDKDGNSVKAYNTLADAVAAAQDGQTVRLLADVTLDAQIATGKAITIDGQSKYTIKAAKKLASADGKAGMFYRTQSAKGTLTFLNVTLDGGVSKIFLNEGGAGETVFDGVTSTNGGGIAYGSGIHISGGGSHATIRNSTLTGSTGTMELNNANYYAANDLWVGGNVYVTVENSVIGNVFVNSAPSATATNGVVHGQLTITGEKTKITYLSGEEEAADKLDKFGNNGSLVKIDSGYVEKVFDKGSYAISGGTFKTEVKKEWCAAGYVPADNGNGTYGVEVGKFTVMVTSRTTGSNSPVANVTGGGSNITYAQGTKVTASAISGYNFVGWFVNEYTGTPYSTDLTCEVKPTADCTMIAVYEPISGGKFWLNVTASEFTVNGGAVQDSYLYEQFAIGTSVTVKFTGTENFLYWVNASNKVVSTDKSYTFIMGSETTLKAVYGKARQNQATVVFISHSDQIISSKAYTTNDTIQFPVPPIKMGCTFTGWSMTEAEIRAAMANNSGIIQVRARYTEPSIACKVTVIYPDGIGNDVVNAVVGKAINVTAKDIEGKTFSYWTDNAGNVLGYTKTLKLAPSGDMTVKAVYDEAAEAKPVITISEVSATTANESYVVTFMATRAVPDGYKVVKQGILWSRDAVCGEDGAAAYMQFDSNGKLPTGVNAYIGNSLELNGVTRLDITTKYNDRTFYGRGYMVLESDAGELLYIYTNTIASGSYDSLTK